MEEQTSYGVDDRYTHLVNQLIQLEQSKREVWKYHPANKQKNDIIKDYFEIEKEIETIEQKIKTLDAKSEEWHD